MAVVVCEDGQQRLAQSTLLRAPLLPLALQLHTHSIALRREDSERRGRSGGGGGGHRRVRGRERLGPQSRRQWERPMRSHRLQLLQRRLHPPRHLHIVLIVVLVLFSLIADEGPRAGRRIDGEGEGEVATAASAGRPSPFLAPPLLRWGRRSNAVAAQQPRSTEAPSHTATQGRGRQRGGTAAVGCVAVVVQWGSGEGRCGPSCEVHRSSRGQHQVRRCSPHLHPSRTVDAIDDSDAALIERPADVGSRLLRQQQRSRAEAALNRFQSTSATPTC